MKQILIIDDEPYIRLLLQNMIEQEGYHVLVASNGIEGMNLFDNNPIDLVITDLFMPEKEGLEIIQEFKKGSPDIPIIAISGEDGYPCDFLHLASLLGANAIFKKPFKKENLINAVRLYA